MWAAIIIIINILLSVPENCTSPDRVACYQEDSVGGQLSNSAASPIAYPDPCTRSWTNLSNRTCCRDENVMHCLIQYSHV